MPILLSPHIRGVYIHIPFCLTKCPYCDFVSGTETEVGVTPERYVDALCREIEMEWGKENSKQQKLSTIFFGGGTPSLLSPNQISSIIENIRDHSILDKDAEVTLETNPGDVTPEKLEGFRDAGVNRISLGFQAFDDELLELLGRRHSAADAISAVDMIAATGFKSWSIDFIYGIPGQTLKSWSNDLDRLQELAPPHISTYALTLGGNKKLASPVTDNSSISTKLTGKALSDELQADMLVRAHEKLGCDSNPVEYEHYEISNFAKPGHACKHNLIYWTGLSYRGFGVGAHSYSAPSPIEGLDVGEEIVSVGSRFWNTASSVSYCERVESGQPATVSQELLSNKDALLETLSVGLRLRNGIAKTTLSNLPAGALDEMCEALLADGLMDEDAYQAGRLALTMPGWLVTDEISERIYSLLG